MVEPTRVDLAQSEQIVVKRDIADPDRYLDELAARFAGDPTAVARLQAVRALDHEQKVAWLLSGRVASSGSSRLSVPAGCAIVLVAVTITVVVGWIVRDGIREAQTDEREVMEEVLKCVEEQNQPPADDGDTSPVSVGNQPSQQPAASASDTNEVPVGNQPSGASSSDTTEVPIQRS